MSEARAAAAAAPPTTEPVRAEACHGEAATKPSTKPQQAVAPRPGRGRAAPASSTGDATPAGDPGEDAYTQGFHLWEAGQYDEAIAALEVLHRRLSEAPPGELCQQPHRPLPARAKASAREAAAAFLANYRNNPSGERAPDSLLYLGPGADAARPAGQACKAYQELDAVYGAKIRPDLKKQEADAKTQAQCT